MATLTDTIRKAIADSDETLYRIAKGAGITYGMVYRFHHGQRDVTLATADKLAEYLGLELTTKQAPKRATRKGKR